MAAMRAAALVFPALLSVLATTPAAAIGLAAGEPADSFDAETIVEGLSEPTDIAVLPDGRKVVIQRLGDVAIILSDGSQADAHVDVNTGGQAEQGLLGVVADPNFATNHYLYFYVSIGDEIENRHKVERFTLSDRNTLEGLTVIVDQGLLGPANHDGGGLIIDDDYLYISVGDTGHNASPPNNHLGTCLNSANGKILRVNLDGSTPPENPLVGLDSVTGCSAWDQPLEPLPPDGRIFAWGLRNPFRFWVDPMTGLLWIGDVGEGTREEVSVGEGGVHYGWPFREGTVEYNEAWMPANACMGVTPATECVPVVHDYPHEDNNNCVIGGLILDACGWPDVWKSRYVFGDHDSGRIWTLDVNAGRNGIVQGSLQPFGEPDGSGIAAFRMGPDHALYMVEDKAGTVQRITPKQTTNENCPMLPAGSGGSGGSATGGSTGNAGSGAVATSGAGGTNGADDGDSSDEGGCGCRAVGTARTSLGLLLSGAALALLCGRRRSFSRRG